MTNGSIELRRNFNKHLIMFIIKIFCVCTGYKFKSTNKNTY